MSTKEKDKVEQIDTLDQFTILLDFLKMLPRMWVLFLVITILCSGIFCFIAYKSYSPIYTASSTFSIRIKNEQSINSTTSFYDNAAAEHMAQTFPYILTSTLLKRTVQADLGTTVYGKISAEVTPNTAFLTLSVTDSDANRAYTTLQSVIKNYPTVSEPIIGKVTMTPLDETGVPEQPDNPKIFVADALKGAGVGLIISLVWGILIFLTNRTVLHEQDIKQKLGITCLGTVPRIATKKRSSKVLQYFLLNDSNVRESLSEPMRLIKNKIEYHCHKHNHKTLLVTSATAGEGKSLFAANMSLSLASAGKKVILVDCDLRHPTGRLIYNMDEGTGLAEYLKGELELEDFLTQSKKANTHNYPNFLFLPGGKAVYDGSDLLSSNKMKELIDCIKSRADYIILDSAPTGLLTDSAVLAKHADGAIMLIRKGFARIDFINDALGHLAESDIAVVGGVLNDVEL